VDFLQQTRTAYDTVAVSYADLLRTHLDGSPHDRAMLNVFAERVSGPVADIGCGPGRITGYLHKIGLTTAFGIDLSPEMIAVARRDYPDIGFEVGSMLGLDLADGSLGGVLAWYSIIHVPPERHPDVLAEFHRVLAPGGQLLVGFHVGDETRHIENAYGHDIQLTAYRLRPERITELLAAAGIPVHSTLIREPEGLERKPQAYLLAQKA